MGEVAEMEMHRFVVVSALALALAGASLGACGDDEPSEDQGSGDGDDGAGDGDDGAGDGDAGSGDGDASSGDGDASAGDGDGPSETAATCDTTTPPSSSEASETQKNETYPTAAGGTISDGVYYLKSFDVYSPAQADEHTRAWLLEIAGDKVASINVSDGGPKQVVAGTFTTSGSTLTLEIDCPGSMSKSLPYTATSNEIWLFDPDEPNLQVYAKE
jgi:hypothetical protein